jgi:peptidoglycan/LPS O-acetylase OafA/YrhL
MLGHFWLGARPSGEADRVFYIVAQNGWIGVDLFFVLSGFPITRILLNAKGTARYFRTFYARRALRIFPLYYGFLFLWFFVVPNVVQLSPAGPFQRGSDTQLWFWTYASNWLSITNRVVPHGLNHFWTLAIEEQFYLVWPAVVLLVSRRTLARICIALVPLGFLFRLWLMTTPYAHTGGYVLTPARMGTLAVGAWLACALTDVRVRQKVERAAPAVLLACAAMLVLVNIDDLRMEGFEPSMQTVGFPLLAISAAAILVLAMNPAGSESW